MSNQDEESPNRSDELQQDLFGTRPRHTWIRPVRRKDTINHDWVNSRNVRWPDDTTRIVRDYMTQNAYLNYDSLDTDSIDGFQELFNIVKGRAYAPGWIEPDDDNTLQDKLLTKISNERGKMVKEGVVILLADGSYRMKSKEESMQKLRELENQLETLDAAEMETFMKIFVRKIGDIGKLVRCAVGEGL